MEKLSKFCLSAFAFCFLYACNENEVIFKKEYTQSEKLELSESLLNAAGTDVYYQGSVGERMVILEGNGFHPNNAWGQRELGVPYLKRGFAYEANKYYTKAVQFDEEEWLGYKAYCWLYFYRDYKTALDEIERFDALTPDFVDYPQSTSVNYMRGVCYIGLNQPQKAVPFLQLHLDKEIETVGLEYIDAMPFLSLGIAHYHSKSYPKALEKLELGLRYNPSVSELHYYKAQVLYDQKQYKKATLALQQAQMSYNKGERISRPYVEEFYAIYQEDIDRLDRKLNI